MEYSNILFDVDVSKLIDRFNRDKLILRDESGAQEVYSQIVVMMLKDRVRCVLREQNDEDFGEFYYAVEYDGKYILVKEDDDEVREQIYEFYEKYKRYKLTNDDESER